jgi:uncharacterized protein (TIGR02145 family)
LQFIIKKIVSLQIFYFYSLIKLIQIMKNVIKLLSILLFVSGIMFTSCTKNVTGVTLNQTTVMLAPGETITLVATVEPEKASNKAVTWESSDTSVATVNNGLVTTKKEGEATITVTTEDGGYTATCLISATLIKDGDGNQYTPLTIGSKIWLKENLKTTKYNDGTPIPNITGDAAWASATDGGYCWYNNSESNKNVYGALYNFNATTNGKICPKGWHVPFASEWVHLINTNGYEAHAGIALKATGTTHWLHDYGNTNETGFTALPGGKRSENGTFDSIQSLGAFWTSDHLTQETADYVHMESHMNSAVREPAHKKSGYSIRCIKNEAQ